MRKIENGPEVQTKMGGEHRESVESERRKRGVMRETGRLIHIWKKNSP